MSGALLILAILLIPSLSFAEVVVETDRPDTTNSTKTVPPGYAQFETGYRYTREPVAGRETVKRSSAETTIRIGVTPALEVRLDGEAYVDLRDGDPANGIGDLFVGAKWRLLDSKPEASRPSFGLAPFVKIPTADSPIGSEHVDFGVLGLLSFELPHDFSLDVNAGVVVLGRHRDDPFVQGLAAVTLAYEVFDKVTTYAEASFGSSPEPGGRAFVGAGVGAIWVVHRRLALDAAVDTLVAGRGPEFGFRIGATLLLGR